MTNIVDKFGFKYNSDSKIFLPIKREQSSVDFANVLAFEEFYSKPRMNGGNTYHNHILPMAFGVFDTLNDTVYRLPAIVAALSHDLPEKFSKDEFPKYDVANSISVNFSNIYDEVMSSKSPVFINSLFKNKDEIENTRICFILYLMTKRPELSVNDYWDNLGMSFKNVREVLSLHACYVVNKANDVLDNINPYENYEGNPELIENKFRNGTDRFFFDVPNIGNFLFNDEVLKLGIFDEKKMKLLLNEINSNILYFAKENSLDDIMRSLDDGRVSVRTHRRSLEEYIDLYKELRLMSSGVISRDKYFYSID